MIQVAQILFILSVLVILHEFGHYITAKMFKVRVEKFYLFMDAGFSLVKKKIGETEWGIGWLPLGGYVKLSGMIDESMDTEQMNAEAQPWEFRSKPAWQRLIIMLGGIIVNVITGIIIFVVLVYNNGETFFSRDQVLENGIVAYEYGEAIGFKTGDKVLDINGEPYQGINDLTSGSALLSENGYYTVDRAGEQIRIDIPRGFINTFNSEESFSKFVQIRFPFAAELRTTFVIFKSLETLISTPSVRPATFLPAKVSLLEPATV